MAVAFTCKEEGGAVAKEMEIVGGGVCVLFAPPHPVSEKLRTNAAVKNHAIAGPAIILFLIASSTHPCLT